MVSPLENDPTSLWILRYVDGCNHFDHYPEMEEIEEAVKLVNHIKDGSVLLELVEKGFLRFGPIQDGQLTYSATKAGKEEVKRGPPKQDA